MQKLSTQRTLGLFTFFWWFTSAPAASSAFTVPVSSWRTEYNWGLSAWMRAVSPSYGRTEKQKTNLLSVANRVHKYSWISGQSIIWRMVSWLMTLHRINSKNATVTVLGKDDCKIQVGFATRNTNPLQWMISCAQWNTLLKSWSSVYIALIGAESLPTVTSWKIYISGQIVVTNRKL